jgi:creatinine amidohydrolase
MPVSLYTNPINRFESCLMSLFEDYFPSRINEGRLLTGYSLNELKERIQSTKVVLPICSLGTPWSQLASLAPLVLPPLYHEAFDDEFRDEILERVRHCFPYYEGTPERAAFSGEFEIVELPRAVHASPPAPKILSFSVDTAVEEHGPHLPLATDTIQSYAVLEQLSAEFSELAVGPPVEYGQLTWGLPFGLSIDLTADLLVKYVSRFANAVMDWLNPQALYVVDVHGSIVHRTAIQKGLERSNCEHFGFRWLHEPLVEFAGERGDQHAGGVETALVHKICPQLVDDRWWPDRIDELANDQMSLEEAVELSPDLTRFIDRVQEGSFNGIVGDIRNFHHVDANLMMERMLSVARSDVQTLLATLD